MILEWPKHAEVIIAVFPSSSLWFISKLVSFESRSFERATTFPELQQKSNSFDNLSFCSSIERAVASGSSLICNSGFGFGGLS